MAQFVGILGTILYVAIFARVILTWFPVSANNPIIGLIYSVTEPILAPIRRVMPRFGTLDFSPIIALLLIGFIREILLRALG